MWFTLSMKTILLLLLNECLFCDFYLSREKKRTTLHSPTSEAFRWNQPDSDSAERRPSAARSGAPTGAERSPTWSGLSSNPGSCTRSKRSSESGCPFRRFCPAVFRPRCYRRCCWPCRPPWARCGWCRGSSPSSASCCRQIRSRNLENNRNWKVIIVGLAQYFYLYLKGLWLMVSNILSDCTKCLRFWGDDCSDRRI